jgi:hypothetical protein
MKPIQSTMIQALAHMLMIAQTQSQSASCHLERTGRNTSNLKSNFTVLKPSF